MFKSLFLLAMFIVSALSGLWAQSEIEKEFYRGNYTQALYLFDEQLTNHDASLPDYRIAALCHIQLSNYDAAIENYRAALRFDKSCATSLEGLADALLLMGYSEEALENYDFLLSSDPENLRFLSKKAAVLMDLRNYSEAGNLYQMLYNADSSNNFYFRRLLNALYRQKLYPLVIELYGANENYPPNDKELMMQVANSYFRTDKAGEALGVLGQIIEADSLYIPAIGSIAQIYFSVYRNYNEALQHYRVYNTLNQGDDLVAMRNHGICEYFTGNFDEAIQILDTLTHLLPDDAFTRFYAGLSHKGVGNTDRALELFEAAAGMVIPSYASTLYHHLGQAYASKRMFEQAIETYKKVMDFDPDNFQVMYDLAVAFEEYTLNRSIALAYYEQFVKASNNVRTPSVEYAENRIKRIREELFFEEE